MIPSDLGIRNSGPNADPKAVAAKMQSMFMEIMLQSMEETVGAEDGLFGGSANSEIYRGMFREHLAAVMTEQVGGALQQQLEKGVSADPAKAEQKLASPDVAQPSPMPSSPPAVPGLPVSGVITSD